MQKTCLHCGGLFIATNTQSYCKRECYRAHAATRPAIKAGTIVESACLSCGRLFKRTVLQGSPKRYCGELDCENLRRAKIIARRKTNLQGKFCSTPGCNCKATRIRSGLCEACYMRIRRNGSASYKPRSGRCTRKEGYVLIYNPFHPLANSGGIVFEHRLVYAESHCGEMSGCFWCGADITWKTAVIDHLNEIKGDNRPENLVASCNNCNRIRGAMIPFIKRMKPRSRAFLAAMIDGSRDGFGITRLESSI